MPVTTAVVIARWEDGGSAVDEGGPVRVTVAPPVIRTFTAGRTQLCRGAGNERMVGGG